MAAASDPTPQFVECGFCLLRNEDLERPKVLPCGHIHCAECLNGILNVRKIIECPKCKQVLNELIESLPDANIGKPKTEHLCEVCKKQPAVMYCTDENCKKTFCQKHKQTHDELFQLHTTISVEEFTRRSKKHEKRVCKRHKNQTFHFGCRKCQGMLCEYCVEEQEGCTGQPHRPARLETLLKEAKVAICRDKAEKRKDELSAILKESDRALGKYGENTEEMLQLLEKTREAQLRVINLKYDAKKTEVIQRRKEAQDKIVKFKEEVVEVELSQLNICLKRIVATLNNDHMIDIVLNSSELKNEIDAAVSKSLPSISIENGVGLAIKDGCENIRVEIATNKISMHIGHSLASPDVDQRPHGLKVRHPSVDLEQQPEWRQASSIRGAKPAPKQRAPDIVLPNGTIVTVMEGDLTKMKCDAIVSSSSPDLSHRDGISYAIAQACGQKFIAEGKQFLSSNGVLNYADIFVQQADGKLAANGVDHVIHAISPSGLRHSELIILLADAVRAAVIKAEELNCRTIALPAICAVRTGVPIATCAECYWIALTRFSSEIPHPRLKQISFVVDNPEYVSQINQGMSRTAAKSITSSHHHAGGSQPTPPSRHNLDTQQEDQAADSGTEPPDCKHQ